MTSFPFVQRLHIRKVRHLEEVDIELAPDRPRHLILTGPNGSGKTSVMWAVRDYLRALFRDPSSDPVEELFAYSFKNAVIERQAEQVTTAQAVATLAGDITVACKAYHEAEYLIAFFGAKRQTKMAPVQGPQRLDLRKASPIEGDVATRFIQFLVNQETKAPSTNKLSTSRPWRCPSGKARGARIH